MKNNLSGRVLVTGSAGYIGTALCNRLEKNNINYLGVDKIADVSPFHHCLDLSREEETHKLLNDYNPEIIYHCGTYSAGDYQRDFLKSYESDSKSLINILSFIRNKGNKIKLIFFSSSYVYEGCDGGASVSESCIINSSNNFGIAKFFFENLIIKSINKYIIFRMSNVFGLGNQATLTAINSWIVDSREGKDLVVWGPGKRKIQYIFIEDVISILLQALKPIVGLYNLGSKEYLSMSETSFQISQKYGTNVENLLNKKEGSTLPFMSIDKLEENFELPLFTTFNDMLESIE